MFSSFGKFLIIIGTLMIIIGLFILFTPKIPYIGRLPGDIYIKKGNFTFYMPLATSLIISLILTFLMMFLSKK